VTFVRLAWIVLPIWPGAIILRIAACLVAWLVIPSAAEPRFQTAPSTS
jgi:phage shock protein PspC (stress-responsive transcriptional regulator)